MYVRKASLLHLPNARITKSSRPAFAAVLAAPIRKLWSAKSHYGKPTATNACLTSDIKYDLVNGVPEDDVKNRPAAVPRTMVYESTADTGRRGIIIDAAHKYVHPFS